MVSGLHHLVLPFFLRFSFDCCRLCFYFPFVFHSRVRLWPGALPIDRQRRDGCIRSEKEIKAHRESEREREKGAKMELKVHRA